MLFASPHPHDRDVLLSDQDREHMARERRAQLFQVVSHGDVSADQADVLAGRDLVIAAALASHNGLGVSESSLLDQMDLAMLAGMTCADIEIDHEPEPVQLLPEWLCRVGDWLGRMGRGMWDYVRAPSPF